MTHPRAFALVQEICPREAGRLWDTTLAQGCDTAWAVAFQYEAAEEEQARRDLRCLRDGRVPPGWEPAAIA